MHRWRSHCLIALLPSTLVTGCPAPDVGDTDGSDTGTGTGTGTGTDVSTSSPTTGGETSTGTGGSATTGTTTEGGATTGAAACEPVALVEGWQELMPVGGSPGIRHSHALAYDEGRGRTVLFGGLATGKDGDATSLLGDTWEWDGCRWLAIDVSGPSPRQGHAMVYDSTRGVLLLFGGNAFTGDNDNAPSDELWQYDGSQWELLASGPGSPAPRWKVGMAYDRDRDVVVVFGGEAGAKSDTWEWDGAQWEMVADSGPVGRSRTGMVYDPQRGETILFGGRLSNGDSSGETWAWDGVAWELRQDVAPEGWDRSRHGMTFDTERGVIVVFGGHRSSMRNDTLEWDGAQWTQVLPNTQGPDDGSTPIKRMYLQIAYHGATQSILLFGGFSGDPNVDPPLNDTWALVAGAP